jgi:hypothetical protein
MRTLKLDPGTQLRGSLSSVGVSCLVGLPESSQPSRLVGPGRIGLVGPRGLSSDLPVNCWCRLSKKLLQVIVVCCGCNQSEEIQVPI